MAIARKIPYIIDKPMGFCPGCGHGVAIRLIAEVLEELGQDSNIIFGIGVGCSSLLGGGLNADRQHCPHGRAGAVCTAMKRVNPHNVIISYQGDGDAYSIGIGESTSAAYRNERFTTIVINNTNYGMTGGQMSQTTLPGQKTSTTSQGRDCELTGQPLRFPEMIAHSFGPSYVARGSVASVKGIIQTKKYIKKAIEVQLSGKGYSFVEILSPCPTNWHMTTLEAMEHIEKVITPYFPVGEFKVPDTDA
ncbi:MAG: thiamine pyrophosphate-dependent enzyme [Megasphaera cerevisiae]|jgi:2-oxoglutarate ferredoxin oxidoreductase subunit beta|nr:thiamine pyrophosphate-dependent enzyme [Megasphaera cerevisiae]